MVKRINTMFFMSVLITLISMCSITQAATNFKPMPDITLSQGEVWQRQQVILTLEITTPDEFARLENEELELSDFEVIALPFDRTVVANTSSNQQNNYKIKVGWILFPLVAGQYEIELPQVIYRPNGGRKIKLKLPSKILNVKPLPSYIPATMPVGDIFIKNSVSADSLGNIHDTQTFIDWNIELITNNVLPQTVPPILRQVKTSNALDIYPETLSKKITKSYQGLQHNLRYKVPVKALQSGKLALPKLSIQYFDPIDAKLKRVKSESVNHWAVNRYLLGFFLAMCALLSFLVLYGFYQKSRSYLCERKKVKFAIQDISHAKNTQQIRQALHHLAQAKGWGKNITLQQLLSAWEEQKGEGVNLKERLHTFQLEQFSGKSSKSFENIKKELIAELNQVFLKL